jgi:hypothetical protein
VDTGSTTVIVDRVAATRARLPVARRTGTLLTEAGLRDGDLPQARIRELRVGEATFRGVGALVEDLGAFGPDGGWRLDGILGMPVLRDRVWRIDLAASRVTVAPAASGEAAPADARNEVPVTFEGLLPHVEVELAGRPMDALLDTGQWAHLTLGPDDAAPLRGKLEVIGTSTRQVLGGTVEREIARVDGHFAVGPLLVLRPQVVLASATRVGLGLFEGRTLVLDFPRSRAIVAP